MDTLKEKMRQVAHEAAAENAMAIQENVLPWQHAVADAVTLAAIREARRRVGEVPASMTGAVLYQMEQEVALLPPSGAPVETPQTTGAAVNSQRDYNDPESWAKEVPSQPSVEAAPAVPPKECAHGHKTRKVGCVSCVLVFDKPAVPLAPTPPPDDGIGYDPGPDPFDWRATATPDKRSAGLYRKFNVSRTDGKSAPGEKHDGCEYFVLDVTHDKHAHAALKAYADSCEAEYPLLARDVRIQAKTQILSGLIQSAPTPPETPITDDATPEVVLLGVLECALGWEGGARLLGNVRAMDIQRAIPVALSALRRAKVEHERARQVAREVGRKYFAGLAGQDAERIPYRLTPNQQELLEVVADAVAESIRALSSPSPGAETPPETACNAQYRGERFDGVCGLRSGHSGPHFNGYERW